MAKEFIEGRPKINNSKSDVELIELLDRGTLGTGERDSVKAILNVRAKKATVRYSRILVWLTIIMTLAVLVQIYLLLKNN